MNAGISTKKSDTISKFVVYSYSISTGIKVQVNNEELGLLSWQHKWLEWKNLVLYFHSQLEWYIWNSMDPVGCSALGGNSARKLQFYVSG